MSARKAIILRRIITNFCTPNQLRKFDDLCRVNKGSACHFGLRLIENYFDRKYHSETGKVSTVTQKDHLEKPMQTRKTFIVKGYGDTWTVNR